MSISTTQKPTTRRIVGMVVGILPNKGIVLPFFSAGGSSTLSYFLGLGVIMGIHYQAKMK